MKQASHQWFLQFDEVVTTFGFNENKVDQCTNLKVNRSEFIFLVLCVDGLPVITLDCSIIPNNYCLRISDIR